MGYNASGDGTIVFNKKFDSVEEKNLLAYLGENAEGFDDYSIDHYSIDCVPYVDLNVCHYYDHYNDDSVRRLLDYIAETYGSRGMIESGEYCFEGEENAKWRFIYDPQSNEWHEEEGLITYLTDDDVSFVGSVLAEYAAAHPDEKKKTEQAMRRLR